MHEIRIVDTTLRDGDISLWVYGMTTGMQAGFDSMELFLGLRLKKFFDDRCDCRSRGRVSGVEVICSELKENDRIGQAFIHVKLQGEKP